MMGSYTFFRGSSSEEQEAHDRELGLLSICKQVSMGGILFRVDIKEGGWVVVRGGGPVRLILSGSKVPFGGSFSKWSKKKSLTR